MMSEAVNDSHIASSDHIGKLKMASILSLEDYIDKDTWMKFINPTHKGKFGNFT